MWVVDREVWILLGSITAISVLVAGLPFPWPKPARRPSRSIITITVIWLGSWAVFIAGVLVLAAVTKGRPPYALITTVGLIGAAAVHDWFIVTPLRQGGVVLHAVGPPLALITYIAIVVMLLGPALPEAYTLQEVGTHAYWEDYPVWGLGFWPGVVVSALASALSVKYKVP